MCVNWKELKIGDSVIYHYDEFDGSLTCRGIVAHKEEDHLIVKCDDVNLWLDDDSKDMFYLPTNPVVRNFGG